MVSVPDAMAHVLWCEFGMTPQFRSPVVFIALNVSLLTLVSRPAKADDSSPPLTQRKPQAGLMLSLQVHGQVIGFGDNLETREFDSLWQ